MIAVPFLRKLRSLLSLTQDEPVYGPGRRRVPMPTAFPSPDSGEDVPMEDVELDDPGAPEVVGYRKMPSRFGKFAAALPSLISSGIDAAATPNIAGGGATDFFRAAQQAQAGNQERSLLGYNMQRQRSQDARQQRGDQLDEFEYWRKVRADEEKGRHAVETEKRASAVAYATEQAKIADAINKALDDGAEIVAPAAIAGLPPEQRDRVRKIGDAHLLFPTAEKRERKGKVKFTHPGLKGAGLPAEMYVDAEAAARMAKDLGTAEKIDPAKLYERLGLVKNPEHRELLKAAIDTNVEAGNLKGAADVLERYAQSQVNLGNQTSPERIAAIAAAAGAATGARIGAERKALESGVPQWADRIASGEATITNVPSRIRDRVLEEMGDRKIVGPKVREELANISKVSALFDRIAERAQKINKKYGPEAVVEGWSQRLKAKMQSDPEVQLLRKDRETLKPMFARAIGHTGVLTELDVQSAIAAIPDVGESAVVTLGKIRDFRGNMDTVHRAIMGKVSTEYGTEPEAAPTTPAVSLPVVEWGKDASGRPVRLKKK